MYLTKRQKEILDFIAAHIDRKGYAPTLEEIGDHFGLSSPATVYKHVEQLVEKGHLRKAPHQGRGLHLVESDGARAIEAPLLGRLTAGRPIEAIRPPETVHVPPEFRGSAPLYVLRVRGNSLMQEQLLDGDLVVVEDRTDADDGETVVALLHDRRVATLRRIYRERGRVRLQPRDATLEPLYAPEGHYRIQGVVVGLLRSYP